MHPRRELRGCLVLLSLWQIYILIPLLAASTRCSKPIAGAGEVIQRANPNSIAVCVHSPASDDPSFEQLAHARHICSPHAIPLGWRHFGIDKPEVGFNSHVGPGGTKRATPKMNTRAIPLSVSVLPVTIVGAAPHTTNFSGRTLTDKGLQLQGADRTNSCCWSKTG